MYTCAFYFATAKRILAEKKRQEQLKNKSREEAQKREETRKIEEERKREEARKLEEARRKEEERKKEEARKEEQRRIKKEPSMDSPEIMRAFSLGPEIMQPIDQELMPEVCCCACNMMAGRFRVVCFPTQNPVARSTGGGIVFGSGRGRGRL